MTEEINALVAKEAVDHDLVERSYNEIFKIFSRHVEEAIIEVGQYLLDNFYGGDIERARYKKKCLKRESLNQLINRLDNRSSYSPSKSWIYQAIGLVVQNEDIKKLGEDVFQMYGNLLVSHKVCLISIKSEYAEVKKKLIKETVEKKLTVQQLKERKKELIPKNIWTAGLLSVVEDPKLLIQEGNEKILSLSFLKDVPIENLEKVKNKSANTCKKLKEAINKFTNDVKLHEQYIEHYQKLMEDLETAIKENTSGDKVKKTKNKKNR